ncbi:MAG TPA: sensor domain-containing diguanylate cyclase, partial [Clostridia bacterium]|nr:sensor domain-containing diguanylate cyclase [Clostridia bacterium]
LNMQKTVLLLPSVGGKFTLSILQGYTEAEKAKMAGTLLEVDPELLESAKPVLVTSLSDPDRFAGLRKRLGLPYFISTPIVVDNENYGLLVTGRMTETPPFLPRLDMGEVETLQAVSSLLASTMVYQRLEEATRRAEIDVLTGLYNRGAHERKVTMMLRQGYPKNTMSAFVLIDLDYLKEINDNYGHIAGDKVLKDLAETLLTSFRSSDITARFGGDEFVVFCPYLRGVEGIELKVKKLVYEWSKKPQYTEKGEVFYSTLSAGISIAPRDGTTYRELLFKSDIALYHTKKDLRNGYSIYKE